MGQGTREENIMIACYIVYNSSSLCRESFESIEPYISDAIVVDGAFSTYPHDNPKSTDETRDIAEEVFGDKLTWVPAVGAYGDQIEKRNVYLHMVPENECFIVMDYDNILHGDIEKGFKEFEDSKNICGAIRMVQSSINGSKLNKPVTKITEEEWDQIQWRTHKSWSSAIYRKRTGMNYKDHHSLIYWKGKLMSTLTVRIGKIKKEDLDYKKPWDEYMKMKVEKYLRTGEDSKYHKRPEPLENIYKLKEKLEGGLKHE